MTAVADSLTQGDLAKFARAFNVWQTGYTTIWCDGHSATRRISAETNDDKKCTRRLRYHGHCRMARWSKRSAEAVAHRVNAKSSDAPIKTVIHKGRWQKLILAWVTDRSYQLNSDLCLVRFCGEGHCGACLHQRLPILGRISIVEHRLENGIGIRLRAVGA
jgi:hypothetical protein